jgi:hypothetical protein
LFTFYNLSPLILGYMHLSFDLLMSVTVLFDNVVIWVVALHMSIRFDVIVLQELDTKYQLLLFTLV